MDLLFKRYASPFSLIDGYIKTARFCEFIKSFSIQKLDDDRWEYFLHKVWDKSYEEFVKTAQRPQQVRALSDKEVEAIIKKSMEIMRGINPEKGGG